MPDINFLGMSDEEFEKQPIPEETSQETVPPPAEEEEVEPPVEVETQETQENPETSETPEEEEVPPPEENLPETQENPNPEEQVETPPPTEENPPEEKPDYEALYKALTSPIKANGREVTIDNVEDIRRLASMGMNYTQKMQEMAPQRRLLATLEKYGLADEARLNYLIDLSQKNPAAIQHLMKDAGINPMEIDPENAPQYIPGSHSVSDAEAIFRSSVQSLSGSESGQKTLRTIQGFDKASQQMVFDHPGVIQELHDEMVNGGYDTIANEVERLRMLGYINPDVPFLAAFQHVGQQLKAQQNTSQVVTPNPPVQTTPVVHQPAVPVQPIAVAPRNSVNSQTGQNSNRVAAAASTRTSNSTVKKPALNPLLMSDEAFEKYDQEQQNLRNY